GDSQNSRKLAELLSASISFTSGPKRGWGIRKIRNTKHEIRKDATESFARASRNRDVVDQARRSEKHRDRGDGGAVESLQRSQRFGIDDTRIFDAPVGDRG